MSTLSKRLAKLEGDGISVLAPILIISLPTDRGEFDLVKDAAGKKVMRRPNETEDKFLTRAREELITGSSADPAKGVPTLWVLCGADEERLAEKYADQLGASHLPLRPKVSRDEWLRLHGLGPEKIGGQA